MSEYNHIDEYPEQTPEEYFTLLGTKVLGIGGVMIATVMLFSENKETVFPPSDRNVQQAPLVLTI